MINKLRKKIFWSIELSAIGVLFLILFVYNGIQFAKSEKKEWEMLSVVLEKQSEGGIWNVGKENGKEPGKEGKERERKRGGKGTADIVKELVSDEIGLVELEDGENIVIVSGFLKDYEETDRDSLIQKITSRQKEKGSAGGIKYMVDTSENHTYIALMDAGYVDEDVLQMAAISLLGLLLAGGVFGIIARQISGSIVKPVEETIHNQKQFIADASHELKTPVAVIAANVSVLEKEVGENRWLDYIKEEGKRMSDLIGSLLQLSRMDYEEEKTEIHKESVSFSLTDAVLEVALPFESVAFEQGITYDVQTPENLRMQGRPEDVKQVIGILLDNALKYTDETGRVTLFVEEKQQRKKIKTNQVILIHVCNTGSEIPQEVLPYIFNRFYKMDGARKYKESSFGLGLAIAKSLTERNGGTISVTSGKGMTEFVVVFPYKCN